MTEQEQEQIAIQGFEDSALAEAATTLLSGLTLDEDFVEWLADHSIAQPEAWIARYEPLAERIAESLRDTLDDLIVQARDNAEYGTALMVNS